MSMNLPDTLVEGTTWDRLGAMGGGVVLEGRRLCRGAEQGGSR